MAPRKPTILVVTEDLEPPSQAISAWLREAGLRVIGCLGPQPRATLCRGRGESCPFAVSVDVVVLDLWLASDTMVRGTPARQRLSALTWTWEGRWWGPAAPRRPSWPLRRRRGGAGVVAADPACAPGAVFRRLPGSQAHARHRSGR